ncbi:MAG: formylglycine-generating enzyme family protein [Armatimonadota bacterium]
MRWRMIAMMTALPLVATVPGSCQEETVVCPGDDAQMALIPAGSFMMGSDERHNARPVHEVSLDAYYMDIHEVTNEQFKAFVDANPQWSKERIDPQYATDDYLDHWVGDDYAEGEGSRPVVNVSWYAAAAYAEWAGKRLPTEAEWERAARGPEGYRFSWGGEWEPSRANVCREVGHATDVCSYEPNGYGLCDMTGNVMEWCADRYDEEYYARSPERNPQGPDEGESRVLRGGAWNYCEDRSTNAYRFFMLQPVLNRACTDFIGFRCAMDVPDEE